MLQRDHIHNVRTLNFNFSLHASVQKMSLNKEECLSILSTPRPPPATPLVVLLQLLLCYSPEMMEPRLEWAESAAV